ncbi:MULTISPECIES: peptidylprolyl isomerase [Roseomonadaceae]|uniref:SurA N-terminal domain-containing protein n=1 Tax=Falsiroseomonas oleicola TaxID=2801474 RepID=A0ABS6HGK6_9PROT|nr:peptidylprolyl isomerase [Roseomonas oleicola]MBU8546867.1 SurA N-terminal domain-containing protein [Roseomonas oleicola]
MSVDFAYQPRAGLATGGISGYRDGMITWFRKLTQTWFAKVLFLLLVLSFAIWGIEDTVRDFGRETAVVSMEGGDIEVPEAQMAARRELQRVQAQLGQGFEAEEPLRRAIAMQAVEQLIAERAQRAEATRLGLSTPDEAVQAYIFAIPNFQTAGQYDRLVLDQFLRQNDMTEAQFLRIVRDDLERIQLSGAVRAGAPAPDVLARALVRYEQERRIAQVVELPLLDAPEPEPPTEAALQRFHANNPERFSTPALREVTLAVLTADNLADQIEISDADLAAAYEQRRGQYETAERRDLQQALLPDQATAQRIAGMWRANPDFAAIEQAATAAGGAALSLGNVPRADLPLPELAEAAFGAAQGAVTDPVQSPFGWHVMRVAAVTPGRTSTLEEVRDRLRQDVALERAGDLAFERANRVEDAIAGGAPLEQAAREFGLTVATLSLDAEGRDAEGLPAVLPVPVAARAEALRAIFAADQGAAPRLQEFREAQGFMGIEIRAVNAPALRPFEQVEADVRLAWTNDAKRRAQEARAAGLLAAVRGGQTLEAAASAAGLTSTRMGPFGRQPEPGAPGLTVPRELLSVLFGIAVNEPTMAPTAAGFAVAQLLEVVSTDPAADQAALDNARRSAQQQMADDLNAAYVAALRNRAAPRISPTLLQQVVP